MGPQNYILGGTFDPAASFTQGLQLGQQQVVQQQAQALALQQQQAAMQAEQRKQAALQAILSSPRPSAAQYAAMMALDPKSSEGFKRAWEVQSKEQSDSRLSDLSQWTAAITNGRPDVAADAMVAQADAMEKTAGAPTADSRALRAQADVVKADPNLALKLFLNPLLLSHPDGKRVFDNITTQASEARTAEAFPAELAKKKADAAKAGSDAVTAEVQAKYAEPMAVADMKQKAAQLGLTAAQTNQAIATTKKFNAETQKLALEAANGDPNKKFDFEKALRGEFTTQAKEAILTQDAYKRMTASREDAVGDIALIFGYMKMLDPTSVVREGEFATAQSAAGVPERIVNLYNKALEGKTVLPEGQRQKILAQARELSLKADEKVASVRKSLMPAVTSYKLDENNIFGTGAATTPEPKPEPPKPGKPAPAAEPTATNPQTGERLVLRGGKWVPLK